MLIPIRLLASLRIVTVPELMVIPLKKESKLLGPPLGHVGEPKCANNKQNNKLQKQQKSAVKVMDENYQIYLSRK
jgi:hypothetical protein